MHLEFSENKDWIKNQPLQPAEEILILAGDVMPFYQIDKHKDFFKYLGDHFAKLIGYRAIMNITTAMHR